MESISHEEMFMESRLTVGAVDNLLLHAPVALKCQLGHQGFDVAHTDHRTANGHKPPLEREREREEKRREEKREEKRKEKREKRERERERERERRRERRREREREREGGRGRERGRR